ncbi:MAG: cytochrome c [Chitinophagaceae bacterium]|nr:cytochrome c [Chitinophagaceae bacterium]
MKKWMIGLACGFISINGIAQKKPVSDNLKASIKRGAEVYLLQCLACHQADGGGVPHLNAPLDGSNNVKGNNKSRLIKLVLKGLSGEELDGENYSNTMAPHSDLSDRQIADVLTYIRNNWTNKASSVTVAEVKSVRSKNK